MPYIRATNLKKGEKITPLKKSSVFKGVIFEVLEVLEGENGLVKCKVEYKKGHRYASVRDGFVVNMKRVK